MIRNKKKCIIVLLGVAVVILAALISWIVFRSSSNVQRNGYEDALIGKWAYNHDLKKAVAVFHADGRAKFEGKQYDFSCDDSYIRFTDKNGATKSLRYARHDAGNIDLYRKNTYVLESGTAPAEGAAGDITGIEGVWTCPETNWTFEFTVKGTFMEDGILTGHYFIDEENGVLQLVYEEMLSDTFIYYQLTDEGLSIEYPWPMVKIK